MRKWLAKSKSVLGSIIRENSDVAYALRCSGGRPACRRGRHLAARICARIPQRLGNANVHSAGRDARLHGRRDARRYGPGLVAVLLGLLTTAGCASHTSQPEVRATPTVERPALAKREPPGVEEILQKAAATPTVPFEGEGWKSIFDGRMLAGWETTDFAGHGVVHCASGTVVLDMGSDLTGINWTNEVPKVNYEIALDAMRLQGSDFFCGLTFPVKDSFCSLILGGWGGTVAGISSVDGQDASENETTQFIGFEEGRWYRVRVRVTNAKIEAWLDQKKIVDLATTGRKISLRFGEIENSKPLGIATYDTTAALREIKMRQLADGEK
jgi:hypothetical protein